MRIKGWHLQGTWLKDGLVSFECNVDSFGSYKFKVYGPWSGLPQNRSERNGYLFVGCYLILLGFVRSKFQCVRKCIWRCQCQFQDVLEHSSDCYEIPLTYSGIRSPHRSPHLCWLLKLEWLTNFEHAFQSLKKNMSLWCPFLDLHLTTHHSKYRCPTKISNWIRPTNLQVQN